MLKGVAILFHKRDSLFRECWILTGRGVSRKDRGTTFVGWYYGQDTKSCYGHDMDTTILCIYCCCYHFIGWDGRYRGMGDIGGQGEGHPVMG